MSDVPSDLKYTAEHEWVRVTRGLAHGPHRHHRLRAGGARRRRVRVAARGRAPPVAHGAAFGEVESTKSVSDLYAPLPGTISARNEALDDQPELINSDPYGEGWIVELELSDDADLDSCWTPLRTDRSPADASTEHSRVHQASIDPCTTRGLGSADRHRRLEFTARPT